ncbi:MAG TPA: TetR/AcrR family transcriptional regulator [Candidatus Limnocylindrales bacterium]
MSTIKPQVRVELRKPKVVVRVRPAGRGRGRERIIAAAMELFGAKGFSDVSMADVARAAGVTKAALYYHFTDKSDLYTTVALARIASIHEAMDAAATEGGTLEERLVRLAVVGFERLESDVYAPHIHAHEHLDDAHHQQLHKAMNELQEPVVRCFAEAGPPDPRLSPRAASELLGGVLFSLIFAPGEVMTDSPLPKDRVERATLAIRLFLGGYWSLARGEDQQA